MTQCRICNKKFRAITNTHLRLHGWNIERYVKKFGSEGVGFLSSVSDLPKNDQRYIKWRRNLKKRPPPWNLGYTKYTHKSIAKISRTFRKKRIDNFVKWRAAHYGADWQKKTYYALPQNGNTAELIGVVLGDGHIAQFPRTECLTIVGNSNNAGFIKRYTRLVEIIFKKKPYIKSCSNNKNCVRIRIYQKYISKRLGVPTGNRSKAQIVLPAWILQSRASLIRYMRGLYEAEGSFCIHKPTCTYKFLFSNRNVSLLDNVFNALQRLGFHPHKSQYKIQVSKRAEVFRCKNLLRFRKY